MSDSRSAIDWRRVLAAYDFSRPAVVASLGGTAATKILVADGTKRYVVRRRPSEFSGPSYVTFDHELNRLLMQEAFPAAPYVAARGGDTWVKIDDEIFEATAFMPGRIESRANERQLRDLGREVARLHHFGSRFVHPDKEGFVREDHPSVLVPLIDELERLATGRGERAAFEEIRAAVRGVNEQLAERSGRDWTVIHGDLHPGNIFYEGDAVSALFDFDYAARGMAIRDIGDCLLLVAGERSSPFDPDDIWSLAQPSRLDEGSAVAFLGGYPEIRALPRDWDDLPQVLRSRWMQIRLRGSRKVPRDDKVRFALQDMRLMLDYLEGSFFSDLNAEVAARLAGC